MNLWFYGEPSRSRRQAFEHIWTPDVIARSVRDSGSASRTSVMPWRSDGAPASTRITCRVRFRSG